ncbi:MAG: toxin-antitoxin system, antitoxin component [Leptospiraceae bacterium]|nr:hypothetical protein [Leptospiraceae bacterium]MCK6380531.1 toxin-antitoxin system, antitoxin component [Leptospiraceae bacterium]NUM42713.1 hypothetical protein [Leptospiraceae bacterium]
MKREYNFSGGVKGKFYTPHEKIEIPVYLEKSVQDFFYEAATNKRVEMSKLVNKILKKEMEIQKEISFSK